MHKEVSVPPLMAGKVVVNSFVLTKDRPSLTAEEGSDGCVAHQIGKAPAKSEHLWLEYVGQSFTIVTI